MNLGDAVVVVGAGPVGIVSALRLAQNGHDVHVFDGRQDPRNVNGPRGRSISLTLTQRGWTALRRAGVEPRIRRIAIPLKGRQIHLENGELRYQPYGTRGEQLDCVQRPNLTAELIDESERLSNIHLHFGWRCTGALPEEGVITFIDPKGERVRVESSRLLAADGATSTVRSALLNRSDFELQRTHSKHFYKEINVPPADTALRPLAINALHVWPRGDCMLVAFPTPVGGFSFTLFLPMDGERSFNSFSQSRDLRAFIEANFADLVPFMPHFIRDFYDGTPSSLVSVRCFPWVVGSLALIGDAAHAMYPFLGQGLNAGLEDVSVLLECLEDRNWSWSAALAQYQQSRKPNCDAVTEIAAEHYRELAEATKDPRFVLRKRLEARLGELYPEQLASLYHVVSFSDRPYLEAHQTELLQRGIIENLLMRRGSFDNAPEAGSVDSELVSLAEAVLNPTGTGG